MESGAYPTVTGLEHDEAGHPSGSSVLHQKMTARRREKLKRLAESLSKPEVFGDADGDVLLVGWGSTFGPIREALAQLRASGVRAGHVHPLHLHPLPPRLDAMFARYRLVLVVEMNDEGLYGYGQLASILRARYAQPHIRSITKTDGLTFRVREIVESVANHTAYGTLRDVTT